MQTKRGRIYITWSLCFVILNFSSGKSSDEISHYFIGPGMTQVIENGKYENPVKYR